MAQKKEVEFLQEEKLAEELTPPESDFMPTPMQSSAIQRQRRKREIFELLKMKEAKAELDMAVEYICNSAKTTLSKEDQELFFADFKKISEYFTEEHVEEDAFSALDIKLGLLPITIESLDRFAVEAYEKGDYKSSAAVAAFFGLILMESSRPWILRGLACLAQKRYEVAAFSFTTVSLIEPQQPYAYLYLAQCLVPLGEKPLALEMAKMGQQLISDEEEPHWKRLADKIIHNLEQ